MLDFEFGIDKPRFKIRFCSGLSALQPGKVRYEPVRFSLIIRNSSSTIQNQFVAPVRQIEKIPIKRHFFRIFPVFLRIAYKQISWKSDMVARYPRVMIGGVVSEADRGEASHRKSADPRRCGSPQRTVMRVDVRYKKCRY